MECQHDKHTTDCSHLQDIGVKCSMLCYMHEGVLSSSNACHIWYPEHIHLFFATVLIPHTTEPSTESTTEPAVSTSEPTMTANVLVHIQFSGNQECQYWLVRQWIIMYSNTMHISFHTVIHGRSRNETFYSFC